MAKALAAGTAIDLSRVLAQLLPLESQTYGSRLEKFSRDARAFDILEGTGDIQRLLVARSFDPAEHRPWRLVGSAGAG
jgi:acyl-CoA dehydrogenase